MVIRPQDLHSAPAERAWPAFGKSFQVRCDTGRSALKLALQDWQARRDSSAAGRVWVPSYICPSVGSAIAQLGLTALVYSDQPGRTAWADGPQPAAGDLLIIVHYFGVLNRPALQWLDSEPRRDWMVLEDCVQSPYSKEVGERGDYAIASLRKWWPAPDGAIVSSTGALRAPALLSANEGFVGRRVAAKLLRGVAGDESTYLRWLAESEQLLEHDEPRHPSWVSLQLLAGADVDAADSVRRGNWSELAGGLKRHPQVVSLFDHLHALETPLAYPILVSASARDPLRRHLQAAQIYCPVHWPMHSNSADADLDLSRRILSLPLDQRYGPADMRWVVSRINDFFAMGAT